jgi:hypothetical protein
MGLHGVFMGEGGGEVGTDSRSRPRVKGGVSTEERWGILRPERARGPTDCASVVGTCF